MITFNVMYIAIGSTCQPAVGAVCLKDSKVQGERVHENRLRNIVSISEEQFGFVKGKSTTDAIFALRQLQERYKKGQQYLHCVFIDLEKPTTESRGKNCIGACDTRECLRSTPDR